VERQNLRPVIVLVVLVRGYAFFPDLGPTPQFEPSGEESAQIGWLDPGETDELARDIFERVNDERVARGLAPLAWHDDLADMAQRWSVQMIASGSYEHSSSKFRAHAEFVGTGENIHMGPLDAGEAHVDWMESDGHRSNILDAGYVAVGVGVVCRHDGRMWATQIFGIADPTRAPGEGDTGPAPIVRDDAGPSCPKRWHLGADRLR
jgi:uncharacterized protein YkwD